MVEFFMTGIRQDQLHSLHLVQHNADDWQKRPDSPSRRVSQEVRPSGTGVRLGGSQEALDVWILPDSFK